VDAVKKALLKCFCAIIKKFIGVVVFLAPLNAIDTASRTDKNCVRTDRAKKKGKTLACDAIEGYIKLLCSYIALPMLVFLTKLSFFFAILK
jgi:hypothetical protein